MSDPEFRPIHDHMHYEGGELVEDTPPQSRWSIYLQAVSKLIQQVENDPEYPSAPPEAQDDYMWYRLNDLEDHNLLPAHSDAYSIYLRWVKNRNGATVTYIPDEVSKPFYE